MTDRARNRSNAVARVVATSRAILTYQVGLPMGALRMDRALAWLNDEEAAEYPIFSEYMKSVTGLPIGSERLDWSPDVLKERTSCLRRSTRSFGIASSTQRANSSSVFLKRRTL